MDDFAHGLQVAQGDRLVDVIRVWGFRLGQEQDLTLFLTYLAGILPEFLRILDDQRTDVGLRGVVAESLAEISIALETHIRALSAAQDRRLTEARQLRTTLVRGFGLCLERKTAVAGLVAIAQALAHLEMTPDVQGVIRRLREHPSPGVRRSLPPL
mgnify:CR=1 FL=1